jgi:hypothetical protein
MRKFFLIGETRLPSKRISQGTKAILKLAFAAQIIVYNKIGINTSF